MEPEGDTPLEKFCLMLLKRVEDLEEQVKPMVAPKPKSMCPEAEKLLTDLQTHLDDLVVNKKKHYRQEVDDAFGAQLVEELLSQFDPKTAGLLLETLHSALIHSRGVHPFNTLLYTGPLIIKVFSLGGMMNPDLVAKLRATFL